MGWGMMEPDSFLSETVTAISTPYCLRLHKSSPMVRGSSSGVGWHEIDVLCLSINAPHLTGQMGLFLKIQHWYCFIQQHGVSPIRILWCVCVPEFIAPYFVMCLCARVHCSLFCDVFVCQSSLLLIYTSGTLNDTKILFVRGIFSIRCEGLFKLRGLEL